MFRSQGRSPESARAAANEPKNSKRYEGWREGGGIFVTVDGEPLPPCQDLRAASADGFEWGYGGSGPAQLALALLADHLGDGEQALALHQEFKWAVVAGLPRERWTLTSDEISRALAARKPPL